MFEFDLEETKDLEEWFEILMNHEEDDVHDSQTSCKSIMCERTNYPTSDQKRDFKGNED